MSDWIDAKNRLPSDLEEKLLTCLRDMSLQTLTKVNLLQVEKSKEETKKEYDYNEDFLNGYHAAIYHVLQIVLNKRSLF